MYLVQTGVFHGYGFFAIAKSIWVKVKSLECLHHDKVSMKGHPEVVR